MKKLHLLSLAFLTSLLFSCSSDTELPEIVQEEEQKMITLGFDLGGDLTISGTPMKQSMQKQGMDLGPDDLFGIQVFSENGNPYAYVVGDDITKISMDFVEDEIYDFKMTYIKDGKNKINFQFTDRWGWPFDHSGDKTILNKVIYTSSDELDRINYAGMNMEEGSVAETYVEVDRYYGYSDGLPLSTDTEKISLDLKRVIFALNLNFAVAEALTEVDTLRFAINVDESYSTVKEYFIPIENKKGTLEIPFLTIGEKYDHLEDILADGYQTDINISIGTPENYVLFYTGDITVERMVRYNLDFTAAAFQASSSNLDIRIIEESLTEKELILE